MGIKRYILLAIIYMLGIGLYVYSFNGENFSLELLGLSLTLPIAVWMVIPVALLVVASISHLVFYNFKDFLYKRALKKDVELFKEISKQKILEESIENASFRTEGFKLVGMVLSSMNYNRVSSADFSQEPELAKACELVHSIYSGTFEDIKKYKLSKNNTLVVQNAINRLQSEPKYALEVLKNCKDINSPLCAKAYEALIEFASFTEIKKYNFTPDKRTFRRMMERYLDANDTFEMDLISIEEMLEKFNADRADYLELAQEIKIKLSPDALIALFEKLYNSKGNLAADAYLYVLYDLQMIDKIKDILDNSETDEFVKFKTVMFLREHGKSIDIDKFLRI
ncbi:MAG: fatty-acid--CoA ligase [Sulfurospirillaceae bacterium]|nr:fatty-acid--CoA ligase [Sulfurospirillaceae bacterium]MDD2827263.1 fatty-acid--CoA ligase [Sulfurospirillaceae bacterium]